MSKRGRDGDLGVEELNVSAWGNAGSEWYTPGGTGAAPTVDPPAGGPALGAGPPTGPPRPPFETWTTAGGPGDRAPRTDAARSWFQRHTNHLIAAGGAFALLVAVVAASSDPGSPEAAPTTPPTTVAPSTTEARPVATASPSTTTEPRGSDGGAFGDDAEDEEIDYRFVLGATPDGFEAMGAELVGSREGDDWMVPASPTLFAADGTSWQSGPWLTIASGTERTGIASMFAFVRPPMSYVIGPVEARTGTGADGIEVTSLRRGTNTVEIAARGLDPLATAAIAHALQLTDEGIAIPNAAIPSGLQPRPDIDVTAWDWGWTPGIRSNVSYGSPDGAAWMSFTVRERGADQGLLASAPYFLTDMRYLILGSGTGVAGTYDRAGGDPSQYVIWQTADREYTATATGIGLDELIGYAGQIVQPGDREWRADLWDDLREEARNCCRERSDTQSYAVEVPVVSGGEAAWRADAFVQAGSVGWNLTRGDSSGDAFGLSSPLGAPVLRVGSRYGWVWTPDEFPAGAVAIVDRSMVGTTLRLTTTGSQPQTVEVRLEPGEGDLLAPYLVGAVVLPWLDGGFVAQLIAPDGQTIAVQTDADLAS